MAADALRPTGLLRVLLLTLAFALAAGAAVAPSTARAQNFTIVPPNPYLEASHLVEAQYSWGHGWYYACDEWGFCSFESYNNQPSGAFYFRVNGGDQTAALPTYSDNTTCETTADGGEACTTTVVKRGTASLAEEQRNTLEVGLGTVTGHVYTYDPPPAVYAVDVTPDGGWWETMDAYTTRTFTITFKNTGNRRTTYYPRALLCNGAASCSINSHTEILARGEIRTFTLTAQAGAGGTEAHPRVRVYHYGDGIERYDDAWVSIRVNHTYSVAVTPKGETVYQYAQLKGQVRSFSITNTSSAAVTIDLARTACSAPVKNCSSPSPSSLALNPNQTGTTEVRYDTDWGPGVGEIRLHASIAGQNATGEGSWSINVQNDKAQASISTAPQQWQARLPGLCLADCFEIVQRYTTPAYVSLDQPRTATLLYRSGQASPLGSVKLDITNNSSTRPIRYSLMLRDIATNTLLTQADGTSELFSEVAPLWSTTRIEAAFSANAFPTGVRYLQATVRTWWDSTTARDASEIVPVLIVNEQQSEYGVGWTLLGHQRLISQPDNSGSVLLEGDGTALYFAAPSNGCAVTTGTISSEVCTYISPPGEFSTLTRTTTRDNTGTVTSIRWKRLYHDRSYAEFDEMARLTKTVDRFGNTTTFQYDGSTARLAHVIDPAGYSTDFTYTTAGRLHRVTALDRFSQFAHDASGRLTSITDPEGKQPFHSAVYDTKGRLSSWRGRLGDEWHAAYDLLGYVDSLTMPPVPVDNGIGSTTLRKPVAKFSAPERVAMNGYAATRYSSPRAVIAPASVRARIVDPRGVSTGYLLDRFKAPLRVEAPFGIVTTLERDSIGRVVKETGPTGLWVGYTYHESKPLLLSTVDSVAQQVRRYGYDSNYNMLVADTVEPIGTTHSRRVRHYAIGVNGRVDSIRTSGGPWVRYTYDSRGRVLSQRDPDGHISRYTYAAAGFQNIDSVVASGGGWTRVIRDRYGRDSIALGAEGARVETHYDLLNRVTTSIGGVHDTTRYAYNNLFLIATTDANKQRYAYSVNNLGWVISDTTPNSAGHVVTRSYRYDAAGNPVAMTNRRGQTILSAYDSLGRLVKVRASTGDSITYTYDPQQRFVLTVNAESRDSLVLDRAGRADGIVATRMLGGQPRTYGIMVTRQFPFLEEIDRKYIYNSHEGTQIQLATAYYRDGAGRLSGILPHGFPDLHRTQGVLSADGLPHRIEYGNPWGEKLVRSDSTASTHGLTMQRFSIPQIDTLLASAFRRDSANRISERRNPTRSDSVRRFEYDPSGRLIAVQTARTTGGTCRLVVDEGFVCSASTDSIIHQQLYTLDKVANRLEQSALLDAGNRLRRFGRDSIMYDADGNMTRRFRVGASSDTILSRTYSWNAFGQLESVNTSVGERPGIVRYGYDGSGRRVRRIGSNGAVTSYLWEGGNVVAEIDGAGRITSSFTTLPGLDRPFAYTRNDTSYYVMQDALGNVTGVVRVADNHIVARFEYEAYGQLAAGSYDSLGFAYRFKAREYDPETELYFIRARYYDPELGRFISEDPLGIEGGINLYVFADADPVGMSDPTGLVPTCEEERRSWIPDEVYRANPAAAEAYIASQCSNARNIYIMAVRVSGMMGVTRPGGAGGANNPLADAPQSFELANPRARSTPAGCPVNAQSPVVGARISSPYGPRVHPVTKVRKNHNGVDYAAPTGTPVRPILPGVVSVSRFSQTAGNMVQVRHAGGYMSVYMHLSRRVVDRGDSVFYESTIGSVGSTGLSSGPHLHIDVYGPSGRRFNSAPCY